MESLLTILIPNYNRPADLLALLNSVFTSIDAADASGAVEVVVVDDFSTEPLERALEPFQGRRNFKFVQQSKKCGNAEVAFLNALQHVRTPYTWLIGNDDLLLVEAVGYVAEVVREFSPGLLILNPEIYKENLKRSFTPIYADAELVVYERADNLFYDFGFATSTTTFSCIVVSTDKMRAQKEALDLSRVATVYSHTLSMFCAVGGLSAIFIAKPLIRFTLNEALDEQVKLQRQAPLNIPFFHQSLGLARLMKAAAEFSGVPLATLLCAMEDEVDKNTMEVVSGTTRHFISYFFLEQFCRELDAHQVGDRSVGHLCYSEVIEVLEVIRASQDAELVSLIQEAIGVYGSALLPREWKKRYLRSRMVDLRRFADTAVRTSSVSGGVDSALKIFGPNLRAVRLRGAQGGLSSRRFSGATGLIALA